MLTNAPACGIIGIIHRQHCFEIWGAKKKGKDVFENFKEN
jgi:hypothetical protein